MPTAARYDDTTGGSAVIPELLWIVGIYLAAAALAHRMLGKSAGSAKRHYVLVAGNHHLQIEWYIRALKRFSRRTGKDVGITVLLENSTDESGSIVEIFTRCSDGIGLVRSEPGDLVDNRMRVRAQWERQGVADGQFVWVELGKREDMSQLPL